MSTTPTNPAQSDQGMQERAATAADSARREAGSVMDDARSQASDVASAGAEQARAVVDDAKHQARRLRSEEHTSELQSLMRISYAVFCLKKQTTHNIHKPITPK